MDFVSIAIAVALSLFRFAVLGFLALLGYLGYKLPKLVSSAVVDLDRSYKTILSEIRTLQNLTTTNSQAYVASEEERSGVAGNEYEMLVGEFRKQGYDLSSSRNMAAGIVENKMIEEIGFQRITE